MDSRLQLIYQKCCTDGGGRSSTAAEWWWCSEPALLVATDLLTHGNFVVIDHFLPPLEASCIAKEVKDSHDSGLLSTKGTVGGRKLGRSESFENTSLRSDVLGYFDGTEPEWTRQGSLLQRVLDKMVSSFLSLTDSKRNLQLKCAICRTLLCVNFAISK